MQNLEPYFTETDRELLELSHYHKKKIESLKEKGNIHPDDEKILLILKDIPDLVKNHAQGKFDYETHQSGLENDLMKSRLIAECPKCKKDRAVIIKSETTNQNYGWKCDRVECTKCKKQFINMIPNNWNDRVKFYDNFIIELLEIRSSGKSIAEQLPGEINMQSEINHVKNLKKAHHEAEYFIEDLKAKMNTFDKSIEQFRDYLLLAKINPNNLNQDFPS